MAEDLKVRLHFGDRGLCIGTSAKLYSQIVKQKEKISKHDAITSHSPQIVELELLWEQCTVESYAVSFACSETLVSLVQHGHAEFSYVMRGLLNVIPSAINITAVVDALGQLLLLQIQSGISSEGTYHCPYGLRSSPHPFISVLTSRPDCWPTILQQVSKLLSITDDRYSYYTVKMLKPFLSYTILNPTLTHQQAMFKTLLTQTLLQLCQSSLVERELATMARDIFAFFLDCLYHIKITSLDELSDATSHLIDMTHFAQIHKATDKNTYKSLSVIGLTLCKECVAFGHDMTSILKVASKMIDACGVDAVDDTVICSLSWLMLEVPVNQLGELLFVAQKVVNICENEGAIFEASLRMFIFPLLQVISTPANAVVTMETEERLANQRWASKLLSIVGRFTHHGKKQRTKLQHQNEEPSISVQNAWYQLMQSCSYQSNVIMNDTIAAYDWLINLQWNITSVDSVPSAVMSIVTSLLWDKELRVVRAALNVLIRIASQDNRWAPSLLPLLLYRLGQEHDPSLTFNMLSAIPQTATHKVCVTSVLKTLQSLSSGDDSLCPLVIRLTTELWKLQDRSFPHLQKLLSKPLSNTCHSDTGMNELLLAKVASIRDVCILRPHHGADLLPMLSKVLNDCTNEREASIVALALDALYSLCQAEVVDLRTMWAVLQPKLSQDKRPLVIQSLCKLLGSAPVVAAETQDYEDFCSSIVELLWQYSNHSNPIVCTAAFTALANFNQDDFYLDDLPSEITKEVRAKIESNKAKQMEAASIDKDEEDEEPVPPSCYMKLLLHINEEVLPAYQVFMSSLLVEEVKNLPRGVYKSSIKGKQQQPANQSRSFDNIPSVLLNHFERAKQPGLKDGLAAGLLCCFEPKKEVSHRDNKPAKRHIVSSGRAYQHMINTLMNQVCVESSEWFRLIQLLYAWTSLIQRAFHALIQSRLADLELKSSLGHLNFRAKINTAWLWVRDKLTDQLKTATKSDSLAQSNAILVLASLALVSTQHFLSLDEDESGANQSLLQHTGQNEWLAMVIDTLLCLVDCNYKPKGQIFTWYQQYCGDPVKPSLSTVIYSNATVGVSILAPLLLTTNTQLLLYIMEVLTNGLPGQPNAHPSHIVQMYDGIAVGMLTARLHEAHYADYMGTEGEVLMIRVIDALEAASLINKQRDGSCGSLLGLAMALPAMSTGGAAHIKAHVANMHRKLVTRLEEEEEDMLYVETLCMCIGCLTAACFHNNIISPSDAFSVAVKLQTLCQQHDQNTGLALCTGVLFHSLVCSSHSSIEPLVTNIFSTWSSIIANQTSTASQKVASLHGLTALVTGTGILVHSATETQMTSDMHNKRITVAKQISQMLSVWSDPAIQNAATWLLGYMHLVSTSMSHTKSGIPSSYSYLPETSILRACIDQLIQASKIGPEMISAGRLETLLSALTGKHGFIPPLPPLNWTSLLAPVLRLPYGEKVHSLCLELAISQCQYQSNAALCVATWLSPALFTTLKESCKAVLYGCLPTLVKALPYSKLKSFIERSLVEPFRVCGIHTLHQCQIILDGLLAALRIPDLPQGVVSLLYKTVKDVYGLMPAALQMCHGRVMAKLAQCLCHLPGEDIDNITSALVQNNLVKSTFVRSYLVCQGKQSFMWLNACVDVAMNLADSIEHISLVWILLVAFTQCTSSSQHTAPMPRLHWLLELMGHTSNVAHGKTQLAPHRPIAKAVQFLLDIFAAAVIAWSSTDLTLILGITPSWFPADPGYTEGAAVESGTSHVSTIFIGCGQMESHIVEDILQLLSYSLPLLLKREPWFHITDKVIDWLLGMHEIQGDVLSAKTKTHLKATVLNLRHTPAFKKSACWTRVHNP